MIIVMSLLHRSYLYMSVCNPLMTEPPCRLHSAVLAVCCGNRELVLCYCCSYAGWVNSICLKPIGLPAFNNQPHVLCRSCGRDCLCVILSCVWFVYARCYALFPWPYTIYTVSGEKVTPCIHSRNSGKQCHILTEFWTNNAMSNCKQITKFK